MMNKTLLTGVLLCLWCALYAQIQPNTKPVLSTDKEITAQGYDSHIEFRWRSVPKAVNYKIYKGDDLVGETIETFFLAFLSPEMRGKTLKFKVAAYNSAGKKIGETGPVESSTREFSDNELADMVQKYTFRYFWDFADPYSGLTLERTNDTRENCVTIGGSGFGIMALIVGVERNYITRGEAVARMEKALTFLEKIPRFKGMWAHWYNGRTAQAYSFSEKDDGGDVVETSFMAQGLLTAREYFNADNPDETSIRARIKLLWEAMEWSFYTQGKNVLYWHWSPKHQFAMNHPIKGYNEALITYVLAASSPTYPIQKEVYTEGWAGWDQNEYSNYSEYYGIMLPLGIKRWLGGPLFFAHYSYLGLDPRGLRDAYADYWQQNVRQTKINRLYCIDNPYGWKGYGKNFWGLTASDDVPEGYSAHAPGFWFDNGTVAPTAALSSMPYTPMESMAVLKNLYRNMGEQTFGPYGFYDAVNLSVAGDPVRRNYIAIDQGPIVVMLENNRSGLLWKYFMHSKDVQEGLKRLGFTFPEVK